jgi:hypothetical protein
LPATWPATFQPVSAAQQLQNLAGRLEKCASYFTLAVAPWNSVISIDTIVSVVSTEKWMLRDETALALPCAWPYASSRRL